MDNPLQYSNTWDTAEVYTTLDGPLFPDIDASSGPLTKPRAFSAIDMVASVTLPTKRTYKLGNLSTLSISSHRDKFPVTSLGSIKVKGFTGGHRTIAGTMVFSSFDRNAWYKLVEGVGVSIDKTVYRIMPDDMPLFDITITFVNETGDIAFTGLLGVTILDEGETFSVDNIVNMESYSYMAKEKLPFQPAVQQIASLVSK